MRRNFSKSENKQIKEMLSLGRSNPEIAKALRRSPFSVAVYIRKEFGGNPNYINKKRKHVHLHEKALTLFLNHSFQETAKILKLTERELKSCMTYAYKDPKLKHIRKDKRRKDEWGNEDLRYLLRFSGVKSRDEINEYLKRGKSGRVIKEKLAHLKLSSKNVNGMTLSQFRKIWKKEPEYYLETTAGSPGGCKNSTFFKIVPWAYIDEMLKNKTIDHSDVFKKYVEIMAMFQRWIHGQNYWKSLCSCSS